MVWTGDTHYRLAPALLTLLHQLQAAYPGQQWVSSPQTGTIGDAAHRAEANSDHNPWLDGTVRALDVAVNVHGVPGIVDVADGPPGAVLLAMVNRMYATEDPRVWPTGYGIFDGQETDWDNPGQNHPYSGADQHHYHVHISVSTNPLGYDSTEPWPLPGESTSSGGAVEVDASSSNPVEDGMYEILQNATSGALRAAGPGFWRALEGSTKEETAANLANARTGPLCGNGGKVRRVSDPGMTWWKNFYLNLKG